MTRLVSFVMALLMSLGVNPGSTGGQNTPVPSPAPTPAPVERELITEEPEATRGALKEISITDRTYINVDDKPYYDLRQTGYTSIGTDGNPIPFEAYYGIELTGSKNHITLTWHNYTTQDVHPTTVNIHSDYYDKSWALDDFTNAEGQKYGISATKVNNGPYELTVGWSNGKTTPIMFYKNGQDIYYCQTSDHSMDYIGHWLDRKDQIDGLIAASGYTLQDSLDDSDQIWAYPCPADYDQSKYRCDNQRWRDLADQLVPDKSVPDDQKAVVIHDWMVKNLAYDHYKADVLDMSRAKYYNDYTGKYNMWNTHVGVCADFATVYCIMLRHVGVPVMGLEYNDKHVWNLVYLHGKWVEVDLTDDIPNHVYGADVNDVVRKNVSDSYPTFGKPYDTGSITGEKNHINYGMYSYKLVTGAGQY